MFLHLLFVLTFAIGHFPIFLADNIGKCYFVYQPNYLSDLEFIKEEFTFELKLKESMLLEDKCTSLWICYRSFLNAGNKFARPQFNIDKMEEGHPEFCLNNKNDKTNWNGIKIDVCKMEECNEQNCMLNISMQHPFAEGSVSLGHIPVNRRNEAEQICGIQFWSKDSPYSKIIYPNGTNWTDIPHKIPTLFNGNHSMEKMKGFWAVGIDMYGTIVNKSNVGKLPLIFAQPSKNNNKELPLEAISPQIKIIWSKEGSDDLVCKIIDLTPSPTSHINSGESSPSPKSTQLHSSTIPISTTTKCPFQVNDGTNFCNISGNIDEYVKCGLVIDQKYAKSICSEWPYLFEKKIIEPKKVVIEGKPKAQNPKQFKINFYCDGVPYCESEEILFQFNPRFDYENTKNGVTMNSRKGREGNEEWGEEQPLESPFPFAAGTPFHLEFIANNNNNGITVEIKLNGKQYFYSYTNKIAGTAGPNAPNLGFQKLEISGDLEDSVSIEFY